MSADGDRPADLVLRGAPVYDDGRWAGTALAVRDGRVVAVGEPDELSGLVGATTQVDDLDGRWLLPGFVDAHVHPVQAGLEADRCDLTAGATVDDYLATVRRYAEAEPDRTWVTGGGWSMDAFPGGVPTAELLDRACPDRPAFLPNRDHHSAWVNTTALRLAGIDSRTADPADGRIERDDRGEPTGALHEGAMALVGDLVPAPTADELLSALLTAQRRLHAAGVVGWQDALVGDGLGMADTLDTYLAAHRSGQLTARVVLAQWWDRDRGLEQLPALLERRQRAASAGLDAGSVKIMLDGVCETRTASVLAPYRDGHGRSTGDHGLSFLDPGDLARYVAALDAADLQVHVHALGDRAVRDALDAVEHAVALNGRRGNRHHLAHVQVVAASDVPRFAALDVVVNGQPLWACRDEAMEVLTLPFLAPGAEQQQYVFGSLLRAGARLAFGSDWPVSSPDPLLGVHVAVNRRAPDDPAASPLLPEEALTVAEALAGYTTGAAYVNRRQATGGRLAPGYDADVVVVDRDVIACDANDLGSTDVLGTYVAGREVYRR